MQRWCGIFATYSVLVACAHEQSAEPKHALSELRRAVEQKDVERVHALLDVDARAALTKPELARLLELHGKEVDARLGRLSEPSAQVEVSAGVRHEDGEQSRLVYERGGYRVSSAAAFPTTAASPAEALGDLRRALARENYTALSLVLTSESRGALRERIASLVDALEQPESLDIRVEGNLATARAPDGHWVELEREDGVWKIRDFE